VVSLTNPDRPTPDRTCLSTSGWPYPCLYFALVNWPGSLYSFIYPEVWEELALASPTLFYPFPFVLSLREIQLLRSNDFPWLFSSPRRVCFFFPMVQRFSLSLCERHSPPLSRSRIETYPFLRYYTGPQSFFLCPRHEAP